jgi:hypothetical protein
MDAARFTLRFDVVDSSGTTPAFFADKGNPPLDNPVIGNKVLKANIGLEHFWQFTSQPVCAPGSTNTVDVVAAPLHWVAGREWAQMPRPGWLIWHVPLPQAVTSTRMVLLDKRSEVSGVEAAEDAAELTQGAEQCDHATVAAPAVAM